jgi:hypothetical protein
LQACRDTKICNLDLAELREENVSTLNVAVDLLLYVVDVTQALEDQKSKGVNE